MESSIKHNYDKSNIKKIIAWGSVLFDVESGKDVDIRITAIRVDAEKNIVTIIREIGTDVKQIEISIKTAQEIGFINLEVLSDYC